MHPSKDLDGRLAVRRGLYRSPSRSIPTSTARRTLSSSQSTRSITTTGASLPLAPRRLRCSGSSPTLSSGSRCATWMARPAKPARTGGTTAPEWSIGGDGGATLTWSERDLYRRLSSW